MFNLDNYRLLLQLTMLRAHMEHVIKSSLEWDAKYRLVFSPAISQKVFALLASSDFTLEWYDPDQDYDDDVYAFVRAVDELLHKMHAALAALPADAVHALFQALYDDTPPAAQAS